MNNLDSDRKPVPDASPARWGGRLVILLLLGTLLLLGYLVVEDLLVSLLWAAIFAYVTWPLNLRWRRLLRGNRAAAALVMSLILMVAIVLPVLGIIAALREEIADGFEALGAMLEGGADAVPPWLLGLPWIGPQVAHLADRVSANPELLGEWLAGQGPLWAGAADLAGVIGRNALKFALALIAAFFVYRDGEMLVADLRRGLRFLLGGQSDTYWTAATQMTQAVVYGLVLTALAQGAIAGIGYWFAGLEAPVLLGILTALFALVPFGAPVIWVSASLWLLWQGALWRGFGLLLWGALLVSTVDNVVRPWVISMSARISFLLVLFGILGGVSAFGLIGLFIGPIVLSVLWAVWRHWLQQNAPESRAQ